MNDAYDTKFSRDVLWMSYCGTYVHCPFEEAENRLNSSLLAYIKKYSLQIDFQIIL